MTAEDTASPATPPAAPPAAVADDGEKTVKLKKSNPEAEKLRLQAEKMRLQAESLRLEVEKESLLMQQEKIRAKEERVAKQDALIDSFRAVTGNEANLDKLVKNKVSYKKVDAGLLLRLAERTEKQSDPAARDELMSLSQDIMLSLERVDPKTAKSVSRGIKESVEREAERQRAKRAQQQAKDGVFPSLEERRKQREAGMPAGLENLVEQTMGNQTSGLEMTQLRADGNMTGFGPAKVMLLPLWVPTPLLRYVGSAPALLDEDIDQLKNEVFGIDTFYVQGVEKSPFAALFRGNFRGKDSGEVFEGVCKRLEVVPGLCDRVQLFLLTDPTPLTPQQAAEATGGPKPVFLAVSKDAAPRQASGLTWGLVAAAAAGTLFTAFAYSLGTFALNSDFFQKLNDGDVSVASDALPIMAGVIALQLLHEAGHLFAAWRSNVKMGPPIFIPSLQVGSFGAITPFLSFPKTRKAMFDVASSGPVAGIVGSMIVFAAGVALTGMAPQDALAGFPVVPAALFHSSLLVGTLTALAIPSIMLQALATPIPVHPLLVVGVAGLIVNALNLMPVGALDGGRITTATFGRKTAAVLGTATLLVQAVSAVFNNYSIQLFWGLLVILFQRQQDLPAQDEISEVDDKRLLLTFALLFFSLATLIPFPNLPPPT